MFFAFSFEGLKMFLTCSFVFYVFICLIILTLMLGNVLILKV